MADEINDLHTRVSVLETRFDNMEDVLSRFEKGMNDHAQITLQIKERLDKQNGLMPHMSEDIKALIKQQSEVSERMTHNEIREASRSVKVKIVWAVMGILGTGLLAFILKAVLGV